MRIERLGINGFGRLKDQQLQFSPTINVIAGPNEAGKSTLAEAMQAFLFGLTDNATATAPNKLRQQFRPWSGDLFGGSLWICLENGEQYRIVRDFAGQLKTRVYREPGATDVTSQYSPGRHGWIEFADRHLGMSRPVFRVSGWIDQGQLSYSAQQQTTLKDKLEHLVGAPEDGVSAQAALTKLNKWLRERINPDAHNVNNSPFLKERERVRQLRGELQQSRAVLESLDQLVVTQRDLEQKLKQDEDGLARIDARLAALERASIQERLDQMDGIDQELTDVRSAISGLDDVAQLESHWFAAAENALADVEDGRAAVTSAQEIVSSEAEARESALQDLEKIERELASLPEIGEGRLSAVDDSVRQWDAASQRRSTTESDLVQARKQLQAREAQAAGLLQRLGPGATADTINSAIQSVRATSQRLTDAKADVARIRVSSAEEGEFDRLCQQVGELTSGGLAELEERERRLELARQQSTANSSQAPILIGLAVLIGLGLGFALFAALGAAIGAVIGGVIGFVAAKGLAPSGGARDAAQIAKNAALLQADLRRYNVETTRELRAIWDRRNELGAIVSRVRESRARVAERQADVDRALTQLEQESRTRDVEQAFKIERQLRQDHIDMQGLQMGLARAENADQEAAASFFNRSTEALGQLASLDISVQTSAEAYVALKERRAGQETRRRLLLKQTELTANLRLFTEHAETLSRCQNNLTECNAELAAALEKVGLNPAEDDPATGIEQRRERFEKYQELKTAEQSLSASRATLIGAEDPADWKRRAKVLAAKARNAGPADERTREELEVHRAATQRQRDDHSNQLNDVQARIDTSLSTIRQPAIIEEELAEVERAYQDLNRLKNALEGAQGTLTRVAEEFRRNFAPRLESSVGRTLAQITAGRYSEVSVDPTSLAIRIKTFERTDLVELDGLSHGTRDAIALLLRASVTQLLSSNGEPVPLFLDDPLVHVDSDRTQRVFDVLQELSQKWQVFYFTQDQRVVDWAKCNCNSVSLCELPPPAVPVGVG